MQPISAPPRTGRSLSDDLAMALDPVLFARACGIDPDPWQADVMRSRHKRMLLNCSRQSGKSTTVSVLALHQAVYMPGSLVLLISPSLRQSGELFRKVTQAYTVLGESVPATSETKLWLELENGSRIISLPGTESTVRGFSGVDMLIIDEAAQVENTLYLAVRPMLATSDGRLITLSTPYGTRGWWYDAWISKADWKRVQIPATTCPRISPEWLANERENVGDWWFRQEYLCQFVDGNTQAFATQDISQAFIEEVVTWAL